LIQGKRSEIAERDFGIREPCVFFDEESGRERLEAHGEDDHKRAECNQVMPIRVSADPNQEGVVSIIIQQQAFIGWRVPMN
jgi:hypothetical protein